MATQYGHSVARVSGGSVFGGVFCWAGNQEECRGIIVPPNVSHKPYLCLTSNLSPEYTPASQPRFTASLHSLPSHPPFTASLHSLPSQPAFTPACFSRICLPFVQNFGLVWRPAMTFLSSPFGGRLGCLGPIDRYARITPSVMTFLSRRDILPWLKDLNHRPPRY